MVGDRDKNKQECSRRRAFAVINGARDPAAGEGLPPGPSLHSDPNRAALEHHLAMLRVHTLIDRQKDVCRPLHPPLSPAVHKVIHSLERFASRPALPDGRGDGA
jgi:hypothetical protein